MFGPALLFAAAMSPAMVTPEQSRRIQRDYPTWAVIEDKSSAAVVGLVVDLDGTVRECTVDSFVGDERLANEQCSIMKRRKVRPALGPDGMPILSKYRTTVFHWLPGSTQGDAVARAERAPDMSLQVDRPAGGDAGPIKVELVLLVKADGSVALCEGTPGENDGVPMPFINAACGEASKLSAELVAGPSGQPAEYVTNFTVQFELR